MSHYSQSQLHTLHRILNSNLIGLASVCDPEEVKDDRRHEETQQSIEQNFSHEDYSVHMLEFGQNWVSFH
jgi:hypothetical protein